MTGILYLVATPIGNLKDLSARALEVLQSVDYILAEDTRVTLRLLQHYQIQKRLISYSEYSSEDKLQKILAELEEGRHYALVSDAGTPGISDPGAELVERARALGAVIVPVVGPSAVTAIVSVFGQKSPFFHFWGFWPQKTKKRRELLNYFMTVPGIHVFFESPYRIVKTLREDFVGRNGRLLVGRELTKKFESFYGGTPAEVLSQLEAIEIKGEIVAAFQAVEMTDAE